MDGNRVQLLRFDMFRVQPHYHYAPNGANLRYNLDPLIIDDGIGWVMSLFERKLPALVAKAGYESLVTDETSAAVAKMLPEIERRWRTQEG